MKNINLDTLSKEQSFLFGLLFGLSYKENNINVNIEVKNLPREKILEICHEMDMNPNDTYFYLDFISHKINRYDLAKKYGYAVCSLYPKFKSVNKRIQNYFINSKKFIDFI